MKTVNGLSAHKITYKLSERARKVFTAVQFHEVGSDVIGSAQSTIRRNGYPETVVTAAHVMTDAEWQEYTS